MAAPVAKIALTPAVATSAAAAIGPTTVPALSSTDVVLFAATSSCGVLASDGKQRLQRGPEERRRDADDSCRGDDGVALVRKRSEAETASAVAPMTAIASKNRSRRKRSASDAANGASTAAGNIRATPAMPTAEVPPTR